MIATSAASDLILTLRYVFISALRCLGVPDKRREMEDRWGIQKNSNMVCTFHLARSGGVEPTTFGIESPSPATGEPRTKQMLSQRAPHVKRGIHASPRLALPSLAVPSHAAPSHTLPSSLRST